MTTSAYEALKKKIDTISEDVSQNKGRMSQLQETAKKKFAVNSIADLKALKKEKEDKRDMETAKRNKQLKKLESIVPADVMRELEDENYDI